MAAWLEGEAKDDSKRWRRDGPAAGEGVSERQYQRSCTRIRCQQGRTGSTGNGGSGCSAGPASGNAGQEATSEHIWIFVLFRLLCLLLLGLLRRSLLLLLRLGLLPARS